METTRSKGTEYIKKVYIPYIGWGIVIIIVIGIVVYLYANANRNVNYKGLSQDVIDTINNPSDSIFTKFYKYFSEHNAKEKRPKRENKTENICRKILEKIYGDSFNTIRPDWLKSPKTGKNLELDCYNEKLKLALEFNGKQHYAYTPYFHKSKKDFFAQVHRDDWKRKKCQAQGITLIEIPYWVTEIDMEKYIKAQLTKKGML